MSLDILGSGLMGSKLGTIFARVGHDVVFSYSRSEKKLDRLARDAGDNARAGTPADAARDSDALMLAVHWSRVDDVLKKAGDLSGKLIVTCSLPVNAANTELAVARTSSGAEESAKEGTEGARGSGVQHRTERSSLQRLRETSRLQLRKCGCSGKMMRCGYLTT